MSSESLIDKISALRVGHYVRCNTIDDVIAIISRHAADHIADAGKLLGLLEPIADQDWHGKWRIQKALGILRGLGLTDAKRQEAAETPAKDTGESPDGLANHKFDTSEYALIGTHPARHVQPDTLNRVARAIERTDHQSYEQQAQAVMEVMRPNEISVLKPEGQRTKAEEWEAAYHGLFAQLNPVMEENARLKREAQDDIWSLSPVQLDKALEIFKLCMRQSSDDLSFSLFQAFAALGATKREIGENWQAKYEKLKEFVRGKWKGDCSECADLANAILSKESTTCIEDGADR